MGASGAPGGPLMIGRASDKQQAGIPFSTMDPTYPKFPQQSGGAGTYASFGGGAKDRWGGYDKLDVPEMERGWMPKQRTGGTLHLGSGQETQRRARQKKNSLDVVVGSRWLQNGPGEPRNRIGPLKPHYVMVTARKKDPIPIEPRFGKPSQDLWGDDVHHADGSGAEMGGLISRTANLDYGSFTLPQKSRKGASTGLIEALHPDEWGPHRTTSVPPDYKAGVTDHHNMSAHSKDKFTKSKYGAPYAAKKRNQSNIKLAALPFQHPRDVYDTARWEGKDWKHPKNPEDPLFHTASWHNPKTMAHVPNTEYETEAESLSNWAEQKKEGLPQKKWLDGVSTDFKRITKNAYKRAQKHSDRMTTARAPSPLYSVPSVAGSIQYAPRASTAPDNFRNMRQSLLASQTSGKWQPE